MKQYIVSTGENIYDVALKLFGSIEGIVDLLACNDISVDDTLSKGTVLNYHDGITINQNIVEWLKENNISVKNSCSFIQPFNDNGRINIIIKQNGQLSVIRVELYDGEILIVDWGDGNITRVADIEKLELEHNYEDSGEHIIRLYNCVNFKTLDFTALSGIYYPLCVIHADEFLTNLSGSEVNKLILSK